MILFLGLLGSEFFARVFGFGFGFLVLVLGFVCCLIWAFYGFGLGDEPESLILAQSERWRHA